MSEKDQMQKLVELMLSTDNNLRKQAEDQIMSTANNNPDRFTQLNVEILQDASVPLNVRMSSVLVLKQNLLIGDEKPCLYLKLSPEMVDAFKKQIVLTLSTISEMNIIEKVADLISELASTIYNDTKGRVTENQKWPNLIQHIFELYGTKSKNSMLAALRVLEGIFDKTGNKLVTFKSQFIQLFKDGISHNDLDIKLASINCLLSLVLEFKAKDTRDFKIFGTSILEAIIILLDKKDEDSLSKTIGKIFDVCQFSPAYFKQRFDDLLVVMGKVREFPDDSNSNLKIQSLETLIFMLESYPDLLEERDDKLTQVVELIFKNMIEIEDEVNEEWMSPPPGFNDDMEEDDDQRVVKLGLDFIDRLIGIFGSEKMIPFLSSYINTMLKDPNWKMRHAAIMTISQFAEYLDSQENEISNLVQIIQDNMKDPNPRIRYACCHALGQFADDLAPDFQDDYHEIYFQIILPVLKDNVPRVVAHCMASLTNFLEHCTPQILNPHFEYLYTQILYWLQNGIIFVQESCLSCLSALAEGSGELFYPLIEKTMHILLEVFRVEADKNLKQLKGSAIECATIIGKFIGKELFAPYSESFIKEMVKIQTNQIDVNEVDPQKAYLLSGWQRIGLTLGEDFEKYIPEIMPSLLHMSEEPLKNNTETAKTHETEEADIAIQVINLFMESYPHMMRHYIDKIYQLIVVVEKSKVNPDTRLAAVGCLPGLIKVAHLDKSSDCTHISKNIFAKLWDIFIHETDPIFKSEFCFSLQKVIKRSGPMFSEAELSAFVEKCEQELKQSEVRRTEILDSIDTEEETKENIDFNVKCENNLEDEFKLEVANLLGKIFESHKGKSLGIFNHLYTNHIIPCLQGEPSLINIQYGIFLIDDALEHLGSLIDPAALENFYHILLKYSTHPELDVRQSSVFGLGLLPKCMGENFKVLFNDTMKIISQTIEVPKNEKEIEHRFHLCKDNCIATFGKMMEANWSNLDANMQAQYFNYWITHLPITHDHKESVNCSNILFHLFQTSPQVVFGANNCHVQKLIEIFQKIYQKHKISTPEIDSQIETYMKGFLTNESIKNLIITLELNKDQKEFCESFAH
jgi:hypothetical protein